VATARGEARYACWNMADDSANKSTEQSELEAVASVLLRHGVEFLVVGGQAEVLMGSPRVTYDTDLCYRRSPENLERLAAALQEIKATLRGAPADLPFVLDARALAFGNNYTLNTSLGPLDLLGWVEPLGTFESLLPLSETYTVGELNLRTIGLEDLIRVKQHIGRAKDRDSLLQLLAIRSLRK
jgi:predicted nucleotidyltransferase